MKGYYSNFNGIFCERLKKIEYREITIINWKESSVYFDDVLESSAARELVSSSRQRSSHAIGEEQRGKAWGGRNPCNRAILFEGSVRFLVIFRVGLWGFARDGWFLDGEGEEERAWRGLRRFLVLFAVVSGYEDQEIGKTHFLLDSDSIRKEDLSVVYIYSPVSISFGDPFWKLGFWFTGLNAWSRKS